jgi:hypothetical protein
MMIAVLVRVLLLSVILVLEFVFKILLTVMEIMHLVHRVRFVCRVDTLRRVHARNLLTKRVIATLIVGITILRLVLLILLIIVLIIERLCSKGFATMLDLHIALLILIANYRNGLPRLDKAFLGPSVIVKRAKIRNPRIIAQKPKSFKLILVH